MINALSKLALWHLSRVLSGLHGQREVATNPAAGEERGHDEGASVGFAWSDQDRLFILEGHEQVDGANIEHGGEREARPRFVLASLDSRGPRSSRPLNATP